MSELGFLSGPTGHGGRRSVEAQTGRGVASKPGKRRRRKTKRNGWTRIMAVGGPTKPRRSTGASHQLNYLFLDDFWCHHRSHTRARACMRPVHPQDAKLPFCLETATRTRPPAGPNFQCQKKNVLIRSTRGFARCRDCQRLESKQRHLLLTIRVESSVWFGQGTGGIDCK